MQECIIWSCLEVPMHSDSGLANLTFRLSPVATDQTTHHLGQLV